MNKKLVVLIGRCAAGKHEVQKRLAASGTSCVALSVDELKELISSRPEHTDIFVVWVKAPLQLRMIRYLQKESDTPETRSILVDRLLKDGKDFGQSLETELSKYAQTKLIRYWMTIQNPQNDDYRLDFIVDYITDMLSEFE